MSPDRSARSQMNVPPRFNFRDTGTPSASIACAISSPSTTCSVKFFEPTTTTERDPRAWASPIRSTRIASVAAATSTGPRTAVRRWRRRRSSHARPPSATRASAAAGIAPARIVVVSTIDNPRKMYSPSPPAPIAAATVAVPTPITVATLSPATIEGIASGNSTRSKSWRGVMPIATPASTTEGSRLCRPLTVVLTIGRNA